MNGGMTWVALELNTPNWGEQSNSGSTWEPGGGGFERFVILVREVRKPRRRRTKKKKKVFVQWFDCSRSNKIDDLSQTEIFKTGTFLLLNVSRFFHVHRETMFIYDFRKAIANNSNLEWYGSPWN